MHSTDFAYISVATNSLMKEPIALGIQLHIIVTTKTFPDFEYSKLSMERFGCFVH